MVLAGGRGRRMGGVVKPLALRPEGISLLEHQLRVMCSVAAVARVVAPPQLRSCLGPVLARTGAAYVDDTGVGPGVALLQVAAVAKTPWLLVGLGDLVAPSSALAERLLAAAEGADGAWVRSEEGADPSMVAIRAAALSTGAAEPSLRKLLARVKMSELPKASLPPDEARGLEDVDTPEQALAAGLRLPRSLHD